MGRRIGVAPFLRLLFPSNSNRSLAHSLRLISNSTQCVCCIYSSIYPPVLSCLLSLLPISSFKPFPPKTLPMTLHLTLTLKPKENSPSSFGEFTGLTKSTSPHSYIALATYISIKKESSVLGPTWPKPDLQNVNGLQHKKNQRKGEEKRRF
ncbi:MAG: hypothetical protein J3R72DRAFT_155899 [Linnemannia gamsii]|nr:MAG: hypothetical protein J3R72DRAFT_155899 [Linnemannia gamsii]